MTEGDPPNTQILTEYNREMIKSAREDSIKLVDEWRKVPCLAVQANGITGYNPRFSNAYIMGYWQVSDIGRNLYVDLDSGEFVKRIISVDKKSVEMLPAADEDIATIIFSDSDLLNPKKVVELLSEHAKLPSTYPNKAHQDSERRKIIVKYRIRPVFYRNKEE